MEFHARCCQRRSVGSRRGAIRDKVVERGPWSKAQSGGFRPLFRVRDEDPEARPFESLGFDRSFGQLRRRRTLFGIETRGSDDCGIKTKPLKPAESKRPDERETDRAHLPADRVHVRSAFGRKLQQGDRIGVDAKLRPIQDRASNFKARAASVDEDAAIFGEQVGDALAKTRLRSRRRRRLARISGLRHRRIQSHQSTPGPMGHCRPRNRFRVATGGRRGNAEPRTNFLQPHRVLVSQEAEDRASALLREHKGRLKS